MKRFFYSIKKEMMKMCNKDLNHFNPKEGEERAWEC